MYNIFMCIGIIYAAILVYLAFRNELVCKFRIKIIHFEYDKKMQLSYENMYSGYKIYNSMPSYNRMMLSISKVEKFLPNDIRDEFIEWEKRMLKK
jgi:hypothetical protein